MKVKMDFNAERREFDVVVNRKLVGSFYDFREAKLCYYMYGFIGEDDSTKEKAAYAYDKYVIDNNLEHNINNIGQLPSFINDKQ